MECKQAVLQKVLMWSGVIANGLGWAISEYLGKNPNTPYNCVLDILAQLLRGKKPPSDEQK